MDKGEGMDHIGADGRAYPSAAHAALGMTHEELLADMARRGETEEEALAAFDRVLARAKRIAPPAAAARPEPILVGEEAGLALPGAIAYFEESVAAGTGSQLDGGSQARPATLADFFGRQDWAAVVVARVAGWSMSGDHIADGDAVLVDTRREARDGDIVLAHLGGRGQLVKRLRLTALGVSLESADSSFPAIEVGDLAGLTIHGVVVGRAGRL